MAAPLLLPELVARLSSDDAEARRAAVVELARRNDPDLLQHLAPLTSDPDASVRYYAKKAVASLAGARRDAAIPAAPPVAAMSDRARARIESIGKLVDSLAREELPVLKAQLAVEEDRYVRATLVKAVGALGAAEDASAVLPFLKDPDARVVANAVEALDMLGDGAARAAMLDLLAHPDTRVRGTLAQALWNYSGKDLVGATLLLDRLRGMAESEKPWDRESAVFVLARIGTPEALALLSPALADPEEHIRRMAREALDKAGVAPASPAAAPSREAVAAKPARPAAPPRRTVHVDAQWKSLMEEPPAGMFARALRRVYDPERPPRENLAAAGIFLVAALGLLFCLLVAVNILMLLAGGTPRAGTAAASGGAADAAARPSALGMYAAAGEHDRVFTLLASRAALGVEELALLDASAAALAAAHARSGDAASFAALLSAWEAVAPESAALAVARGDHALKFASDPVRAAENHRLALKRSPGHPPALLGLGDAELLSGRADAALPHYLKALEAAPEDARALFSAANAHAHRRDFAAAEPLFRRAAEASPLSPLPRYGLGKTLAALARTSEAALAFDLCHRLDPAFAPAPLSHARMLRATDPAGALERYARARAADPDALEPLAETARLLFDLAMWSAALPVYEQLLERSPDDARARGEYGAALLGAGFPGRAAEELARAAERDPACGVARYHLGLLADADGDARRAEEHLLAALDAGYEPRATLLTLASIRLAAGRHEEAAALARQGLERFPGDLAMTYNLGAALYAAGRAEEAKSLFLGLAGRIGEADADLAARIRFFMARLGAPPAGEGDGK